MTKLSELKPKKKERVYDLLEQAGIEVPKNRNQNFLSRCAFGPENKIVVLNFWYGTQIKQQGENVIVQWCLPTTSKEASPRMQRVHEAIKSAIENNLKIRIIVLDGEMGNANKKSCRREATASAKVLSGTGGVRLQRDGQLGEVSLPAQESQPEGSC